MYEDHHRRKTTVVRLENGQNQQRGNDIDDDYVNYVKERVLLTTTNKKSAELNKRVIDWIEGDMLTSYSYDSVDIDDEGEHINEELLNRLELTGFPPHCLQLKRKTVVILIRNVDSQQGLCNETRCLVLGMETKC